MENFHVDLAEVVAVVTGASRGAGRAVATVLGEAGATVYVTGRSVRGSRRCGDVRRRMPNPSTTRDWRGTATRSVARHGGRACKRVSCAAERSKTSGRRDRSSCSGDSRLGAAPCGDFRLILARDLRGMKRSRRSLCQIHVLICRTITGATGLEPATSGVTGRSCYSRVGRGQAGIFPVSRTSVHLLAGIRGRRRELAAASCGMSAG
jgi:hypothetical protein